MKVTISLDENNILLIEYIEKMRIAVDVYCETLTELRRTNKNGHHRKPSSSIVLYDNAHTVAQTKNSNFWLGTFGSPSQQCSLCI